MNTQKEDSQKGLSRRLFMSYFSAIGLTSTLLPGILWAKVKDSEEGDLSPVSVGMKDITLETAKAAAEGAGLEFTVGYWLRDVQNGQMNLRSDINRAILAALRANHIEIPYPQRVVHQR